MNETNAAVLALLVSCNKAQWLKCSRAELVPYNMNVRVSKLFELSETTKLTYLVSCFLCGEDLAHTQLPKETREWLDSWMDYKGYTHQDRMQDFYQSIVDWDAVPLSRKELGEYAGNDYPL